MKLDALPKLPGRVLRRIFLWADYLRFVVGLGEFRALARRAHPDPAKTLLVVSGRGMNVVWAQLWSVLALAVSLQGYAVKVATTRGQRLLNAYYRSLGAELVFMDDLRRRHTPDADTDLLQRIESFKTFEDFSGFSVDGAPVGQIALSTYSRHVGTGLIDIRRPEVKQIVAGWAQEILSMMRVAAEIYDVHRVSVLFFSEVFMEEYGAFYYEALKRDLNVIRCAGTVRDDAFIFQHLSRANDRIHHSSIDPTTWARLKQRAGDPRIDAELRQNFDDRYGEKWHRSRRNHPGTKIVDVSSAREQLGIRAGRKVAVIYSHILYDTLFFFGTDLFQDYAEWLVETTRAAIANSHIDWLIKVHPSNLWRGELGTLLKGQYEEEQLLVQTFGMLPPHVRIVPADTRINPLTWFQLADYGITVRGTSGLEMAALGKTVITAGTGRYEGNGFTIDPTDAAAYMDLLERLQEVPPPDSGQVELARLYAHAIFVLKPYTLTSMQPRLRTGRPEVRASDDLVYMPARLEGKSLPRDLARFAEWALRPDDRDLLSGPSVQ